MINFFSLWFFVKCVKICLSKVIKLVNYIGCRDLNELIEKWGKILFGVNMVWKNVCV